MKYFIYLLFFLYGCTALPTTQKDQLTSSRIAFYNVENLFDTLDHPLHADEEFTPFGKKQWNSERYQKKLSDLAKVVEGMAFPDLIGVSEVENIKVLEDLVQQERLRDKNYEIVHFESPDYRGIDVGLLYAKKAFKVKKAEAIRIDFPTDIVEDYTTRDILKVEGVYRKKYRMHIFVNHWPSRRGGLAASEPKRVYVAQQLKREVDQIVQKDADAAIVILGDFNDETDNKSISEVLAVSAFDGAFSKRSLYNSFSELDDQKKGTYSYKGNWNMLDQIIVSSALRDSKGLEVSQPTIFQAKWMTFQHKEHGAIPNRTYGGPNYYGGISDHFPVYIDLIVK